MACFNMNIVWLKHRTRGGCMIVMDVVDNNDDDGHEVVVVDSPSSPHVTLFS